MIRKYDTHRAHRRQKAQEEAACHLPDEIMKKDGRTMGGSTNAAYGRFSQQVFSNNDPNIRTQIMVFRAVVLFSLLYAFETGTLYQQDVKRSCEESFASVWMIASSKLRSFLWTSLIPIETAILQHRLRLACHVSRMHRTYHLVWRTRQRQDATRRLNMTIQGPVEDIPEKVQHPP